MLDMELSSDSDAQVEDESSTLVDEDSDDEEKNDDSSKNDVNDEILQKACCSIDQDDIASSINELKSSILIKADLLKQLAKMEAVSLKKMPGTSLLNNVTCSKTIKQSSRCVEVEHNGHTHFTFTKRLQCGYFRKVKEFQQIACFELDKSNHTRVSLTLRKSKYVTPMLLIQQHVM